MVALRAELENAVQEALDRRIMHCEMMKRTFGGQSKLEAVYQKKIDLLNEAKHKLGLDEEA